MEPLTWVSLAVAGFGVILFFVFANKRSYRRHPAVEHYTQARDELSEVTVQAEEESQESTAPSGSGGIAGLIATLGMTLIVGVVGWNILGEIQASVLNSTTVDASTSVATTMMFTLIPIFFVVGILLSVVKIFMEGD